MNKILHCIGLLNAAVTNGESMTPELVQARKDAYGELEKIEKDLEIAEAYKSATNKGYLLTFENDYGDITHSLSAQELIYGYRHSFLYTKRGVNNG